MTVDAEQDAGKRKHAGQMFALRFIRLLGESRAADDIGPEGCWLLTTIVMAQDRIRFARPVKFFNDSLCERSGLRSEGRLIATRSRCVASGWLRYEPGAKRRQGTYAVQVPDEWRELLGDPGPADDMENYDSESHHNLKRIQNESVAKPERIQSESNALHSYTVSSSSSLNENVNVHDNDSLKSEDRQDQTPKRRMTDEQRAEKQQRALDEIRATFNCLTKAYFQRTLKPVFAKRVDPIAPITPATIEKLDALAEWLRMQAGCQKPMFPASVEMLYVLWAIVAHCKRSNVKRPVAKFVAILARRDLQVALKTMPDTQQQTGFYVDSIKATEFVEPEAPTTDGAKRDEHSGDTSN